MRAFVASHLLLAFLVLASDRVQGRPGPPEPMDLTHLSLAQLLEIQVCLPTEDDPSSVEGAFVGRPSPLLPAALRWHRRAGARMGPRVPRWLLEQKIGLSPRAPRRR